MAPKYYLKPYTIGGDSNQQTARIIPNQILDEAALVARMLKRGTTLTAADLHATLTLLCDTIADELSEGNHVNLSMASFRPGINGMFRHPEDDWDATRHHLKAVIVPGARLSQKLKKVRPQKASRPVVAPVLLEFRDFHSGIINQQITPHGMGEIVGKNLKYHPERSDEGIFLKPQTGAIIRIPIVATVGDARLLFSIPEALSAGSYRLEVRARPRDSSNLYTGALDAPLTVL